MGLLDTMRERVPLLRHSLDEWTVRMMRWHFGEKTGSPFWLERRRALPFDPLTDVTDFASLRLFGLFDKADLRAASVRDLLPQGFAGRPFRIVETGGTTGSPCRVVDVTRARLDVEMYRVMLEARGVLGGDVLAMTPSGPHAYGHFVKLLGDSWGAAVYSVDFDPRWVKTLLRRGRDAGDYVEHLIEQTRALLEEGRPSLLFTTSKLLLSLAPALPEPLAAYGVRAVSTGGTSCTEEERRYLREEYLDGVQWIDTYGNTLMGHALQGDAVVPGRPNSYHQPPPLAVMRVVRPDDVWTEVAVGERGRVLVTTLLEDLFLPNLLERDAATRTGPHPWFPWDGVAEVGPWVEPDAEPAELTEGVY
jgi:phenylacetate-coenzyme A ligase PaaK-like adenylate-forming protein